MTQWVSFTVFVGVLTLLLLVLARHSQTVLESAAESGTDRRDATTTDRRDATTTDRRDVTTTDRRDVTTTDRRDATTTDRRDASTSIEGRGTEGTTGGERTNVDVHERFTEAPSTGPEGGSEIVPESDSLVDGHQSGEPHSSTEPNSIAFPDEESPASELELTSRALLANVAVTQGLVIVLVLGGIWYFSIPYEALGITGTPMSTGLPAILGGIGFGVLLWVGNELSTTVADVVGAAYDESVRELLAPDSPGGWIVLFGVVLPIIAVAEELLFRAALIGVPAAGFDISPWLLALVSSLAFALGHGAQGSVGIVVTGVLGFVLATAFIVTGSLLLVIVAHYVINALEFLLHEYVGIEGLVEELTGMTPLS